MKKDFLKKKIHFNFYVQALSNRFHIIFLLFSILSLILISIMCWKITGSRLEMEGRKAKQEFFPTIDCNTGIKGNNIHSLSASVSHWQNKFNGNSYLHQRLVGRIDQVITKLFDLVHYTLSSQLMIQKSISQSFRAPNWDSFIAQNLYSVRYQPFSSKLN